jgi:hypothetical protein
MIVDKLMTVGSVGVVAAVIASLSEEATHFAAGLYSGASQVDFAMVRSATARVPEILTATMTFYGADHAMLVFLAFGALVFLGLMFRT